MPEVDAGGGNAAAAAGGAAVAGGAVHSRISIPRPDPFYPFPGDPPLTF